MSLYHHERAHENHGDLARVGHQTGEAREGDHTAQSVRIGVSVATVFGSELGPARGSARTGRNVGEDPFAPFRFERDRLRLERLRL